LALEEKVGVNDTLQRMLGFPEWLFLFNDNEIWSLCNFLFAANLCYELFWQQQYKNKLGVKATEFSVFSHGFFF
jgi:hypothetical protein